MQQSSDDQGVKKIDGHGKSFLSFAGGLILLTAITAGGAMGCQKLDADPQEKQDKGGGKSDSSGCFHAQSHKQHGQQQWKPCDGPAKEPL